MDNNQQKDNRPGGGRMPNGNKVPFMAILAIALVVILGITMFSGMFRSSSSTEISYDKFLDWLDAGYIKSVTMKFKNRHRTEGGRTADTDRSGFRDVLHGQSRRSVPGGAAQQSRRYL